MTLLVRLQRRGVVAGDLLSLRFQLESPRTLAFRGGQFVTLRIPAANGGPAVERSYSIASRKAGGDELRLVVRLGADGVASSFLAGLPEGTPIEMTGPHGGFGLEAAHPGDAIFCVTGTGASPLVPMLDELGERREPGRRLVFWGVRARTDLEAYPELNELCARAGAELFVHVSSGEDGWTGPRGRITPAVMARLAELASPTFYLIGKGAMVRELRSALMSRGVDRVRQIRNEAFFD